MLLIDVVKDVRKHYGVDITFENYTDSLGNYHFRLRFPGIKELILGSGTICISHDIFVSLWYDGTQERLSQIILTPEVHKRIMCRVETAMARFTLVTNQIILTIPEMIYEHPHNPRVAFSKHDNIFSLTYENDKTSISKKLDLQDLEGEVLDWWSELPLLKNGEVAPIEIFYCPRLQLQVFKIINELKLLVKGI